MSDLLIYYKRNVDPFLFENRIKVNNFDNFDKNIADKIIPKLLENDFDRIFIKDNLSTNYLELLGLRAAYHIRLSKELGEKRYCPIIILSDLDSHTLNKLDPMAKILFTKNIYLIENTLQAIKKAQCLEVNSLTIDEYQNEFLKKVDVEQPKDYLTHHSIANEWSMYRWAEYLEVNTPDIVKIRDNISSMLYFKYLQAKFPIKRSLFAKHKQELTGEGKVLYIDDEWEKGWKSIFENLLKENDTRHFETVEKKYKDKTKEEIISFIMKHIINFDPDVIILDMRLHEDDFLENVGLADLTGIQVFNKIKEINPAIQVIIFTASSNSLLLDEIHSYNHNILGYVKKEHPENYNLTTQSNINKLINLVNKGLNEKYLKDIYSVNKKIINLLNIDIDNPEDDLIIFEKYHVKNEKYISYASKIYKETNHVFDILNSNTSNKYPYAMLSIARSLEAILSIFITEKRYDNNKYWDGEDCYATKFEDKIIALMKKLGYEIGNLSEFIDRRNKYIHSNPAYRAVTKEEIEKWFEKLLEVIIIIASPPNFNP